MWITFVHVRSESGDDYYYHWVGSLSDEEITIRLIDELGDEYDHCYTEFQESFELG